MLRRRVAAVHRAATLFSTARTFFNPFGGAGQKDQQAGAGGKDAGAGFSGLPPGIDAQKLRTMQELFNSQSPEKQKELMQQALDFQKSMSKIPGFGKFAQKNAAMMEQMMKLRDQEPKQSHSTFGGATAGNTAHNRRDLFQAAPRASSSSGTTTSMSTNEGRRQGQGPTLDDLRKVNLGPEIESLFEELRTMRAKKNEYRDKYFTASAALEKVQAELNEVRTREASVRQKLAKAEKDVMLLTSENMELRDSDKQVKRLTQANRKLSDELRLSQTQKAAATSEGSPAYTALQQQLRAKDEALRSLHRKVERMRRRDPLLQFSLACSDVARLCDEAHDPAKDSAEESFAEVQRAYLEKQQSAWRETAEQGGAAARVFIAVARRYMLSKVPYSHLDAVVTIQGDIRAAKAAFEALGFVVSPSSNAAEPDRLIVSAPADAAPRTTAPGPYGYAFAWRLAADAAAASHPATSSLSTSSPPSAKETAANSSASFAVVQAHPHVSAALSANEKRAAVVFETARASGPGGQATNVSETHVYAKLTIDGQPAFTAEAQDSRSALQNKDSAVEKLHGERRQTYNDTLARQRAEDVFAKLSEDVRTHAGGVLDIQEDVQRAVQEAAAAQLVPLGDAVLVRFLTVLGHKVNSGA